MLYKSKRIVAWIGVAAIAIAATAPVAFAQRGGGRGGPGERPPAKVVLTKVDIGNLAPKVELPGNVFFKEVAQLATEVAGKVTSVEFEEGQHVKKDQVLVRLDASVLEKDLESAEATFERRKTELEDAKVRFDRAKDLLEDDVTTPQEYDNLRFAMEGIRFQVDESKAEVDRLKILIGKHVIRAPFDAIVLERSTELGEWKNTGVTVAAIALENVYDVIVFTAEKYLPFLGPGQDVPVNIVVQDQTVIGKVVTIIQRGDTKTLQFPLKIRVEYDGPLYEGMGVMVSVPRAAATECLIVERDAVLLQSGQSFVYTADDGVVKRHEVEIVGFDGMDAGIRTADVGPGDLVIVKGHERLHDGDEVVVVEDVLSPEHLAGG